MGAIKDEVIGARRSDASIATHISHCGPEVS